MTKCCLCGKFMSDDDVLLGCSRDLLEGGQEYAHEACVYALVLDAPEEKEWKKQD